MKQNETKSCLKVAPEFSCQKCDYTTSKKSSFDKHLSTDKHILKQNETKSYAKVAPEFNCQICDYTTCTKSSFDKHLSTAKHILNQKATKSCSKVAQPSSSQCLCGVTCNSRTTLWRHKKKCNYEDTSKSYGISEQTFNQQVIEALIKITQNGTMNHSNSNSNNTNIKSNNKTFNLNFFLNETCKDAMNISEFVNSVKVDLDDLEHTGRQGYVQGITNIVVKNLNKLEEHLRPLHCSDSKREILYIKDNDEWIKETEDKPILTKAIKIIANENIKQIKHWQNKYPDCIGADSKKNNLYLKIVSNSMNGLTKEESDKNINKIISNLSKEVIIDKYD